jgi:hypothetical protein
LRGPLGPDMPRFRRPRSGDAGNRELPGGRYGITGDWSQTAPSCYVTICTDTPRLESRPPPRVRRRGRWTDFEEGAGASVTKEAINPPSVFRSAEHGFSQAVLASGRRTLYVSGQTAWDSQKQLIGGADLEGPFPAFVGEASLCLWLLAKGVNVSKWKAWASAKPAPGAFSGALK